jgi:hypothetical protein
MIRQSALEFFLESKCHQEAPFNFKRRVRMAIKDTAKKKGKKVNQDAEIPLTKSFLGPLVDDGDCPEKDNCPDYKEKGYCDLSCFPER